MKVPGLRRAGDVNPFEAYLILAAEIQGVSVLLGFARPTSVREALAPAAMYFWAALLAGGGATTLLGLFWWGNAFNGIDLLRVGLVALAGGTAVYAVAAGLLGSAGFAVAVYNAAFAVACLVRVRQVTVGSRHARGLLVEGGGGSHLRGVQGGG